MRKGDGARVVDACFDKLEQEAARAFTEANKELGDYAKEQLIWMSGGVHKAAELRRMDYPFATRHPAPRLDTEILNRQTGNLQRLWKNVRWQKDANGVWMYLVFNAAMYASYLQDGTWEMVKRDILDPVYWMMIRKFPHILRRKLKERGF